ncbi:MAG TPA: DUF2252 family protein [Bryobacteraceae bacterium]|jgi:hypothetical protein|nr:DUF2252 family protein [Bryobacteraceae bacterium]
MNIVRATQRYEAWLGKHLTLIERDLEAKHEAMRSAAFPFLRATYYRWAQTWQKTCGPAARAPRVLAVGDLHVENFGTWRDIEGRLIWGVNDFDEAWNLPYTNDLIRLATSALLAKMSCEPAEAMAAILKGYADSLAAGGRPFVLAEHHPVLRGMAIHRLHEPEKFWDKLHGLNACDAVPKGAMKAIGRMMPERGMEWKTVHRMAGLGSLGRERYVGLADWRGGSVAREAKALAPSACIWAMDGGGTAPILYQKIVDSAVRCRDPFVRLQKRWIVRRLAPDCSRIELSALPEERDELRLLHAMGFETANVHLGSIAARKLAADLRRRPRNWLYRAAREMEKAVRADYEEWAAG